MILDTMTYSVMAVVVIWSFICWPAILRVDKKTAINKDRQLMIFFEQQEPGSLSPWLFDR